MLIVLLRHGETAYNAQRRYQGKSDIPLSARGRARLRAADFAPDVVFVTALCRTAQTAAAIFPGARQRDFVQRVAAENALHAAQILPVHADKQVVSVVIRFSELPRTVPASGQAMAHKLPLRPRMHGIADFLRADRRRIRRVRPFEPTLPDFCQPVSSADDDGKHL